MRVASTISPEVPSAVDPVSYTPHFSWINSGKGSAVAAEGVRLVDVAHKLGTPTYVYSRAAIEDAHRELHRGLGNLPHTLCFAVKANSNLVILEHLAKLGSGFDIVSGGELLLLRHIGVRGDRIVFSGVGKTREEMREALRYPARRGKPGGILLFNIESEAELETLLEESARQAKRGVPPPSVSIRVNPDVQAGGHPHIATGCHNHKFGLDWQEAHRLYRAHRDSKWMHWKGISVHIGSQIVTLDPFRQSLSRLAGYIQALREGGISLKYLDFGGGLGVRYTTEKPPAREVYARMIGRAIRPLGLHLLLEPGRTIIGPAGVLLTRVLYTKENRGKKFVIVDAAMNDLMRPALYGAIHPITPVTREPTNHNSPQDLSNLRPPDSEPGRSENAQAQVATVRERLNVAQKNVDLLQRPAEIEQKRLGIEHGRAEIDGQRVNFDSEPVDIVGPVCETGDSFLRDWPLAPVASGDVLAIWVTGAYGMSQSSNYNARRRPAEVLVEGKRFRLIRRRETPKDLLRNNLLA
jgi:diaminopimelate decarboxylase